MPQELPEFTTDHGSTGLTDDERYQACLAFASLDSRDSLADIVMVSQDGLDLAELDAVAVYLDLVVDVRQAVAAVKGTESEARLVAFVVSEPGRPVIGSELRKFLRRRLPDYMVPDFMLGDFWMTYIWPTAMTVAGIVAILAPLLFGMAYLTYVERKVIGAMQLRKGPNVVGPFGLFQPFADTICAAERRAPSRA